MFYQTNDKLKFYTQTDFQKDSDVNKVRLSQYDPMTKIFKILKL